MVTVEEIARQYADSVKHFPKLQPPVSIPQGWKIIGAIDVIDDEGSFWDTYEVEIVVPRLLPEQLFEISETSKKIDKSPNWHNASGCCLSTKAMMYAGLGDEITLLNWLTKFVVPYFANHVYRKRTGSYASGEFEHYTPGIIQGYERLFELSDSSEVVTTLSEICSTIKLNRNDGCFCGSGKKFKHCFLINPISHRYKGVPYPLMEADLSEITRHLQMKRM